MATKKEPAAQAVENAVETVEKVEAATEEKDDGMVTIRTLWGITGRSQDGSLQRRWQQRAQAARAALRAEGAAERKVAGAAGRTVSCKVWQRHFYL